MAYFTFISHSGDDTWIARKLAQECTSVGAQTFLDEAQIAIGAKFENEISAALSKADEILVLATPWALGRPYLWLEIGVAWYRQIPMVVVLHGLTAAEFQARASIPVALKERNLIPINGIDRYFAELGERANSSNARHAP